MSVDMDEHLSLFAFSLYQNCVACIMATRTNYSQGHTIKLKSIADPCASCFGVAQILLCQKMHDHMCCICKEILLFVRQSFPFIPFLLSCMNRHYSILYKEPALSPPRR